MCLKYLGVHVLQHIYLPLLEEGGCVLGGLCMKNALGQNCRVLPSVTPPQKTSAPTTHTHLKQSAHPVQHFSNQNQTRRGLNTKLSLKSLAEALSLVLRERAV